MEAIHILSYKIRRLVAICNLYLYIYCISMRHPSCLLEAYIKKMEEVLVPLDFSDQAKVDFFNFRRLVQRGITDSVSSVIKCWSRSTTFSPNARNLDRFGGGFFNCLNLQLCFPSNRPDFDQWWMEARCKVKTQNRQGFDTQVILIAWGIWKEQYMMLEV
uniref:Uncharacterized protein n=1 Tax=Oryza glumipatula TaxID=40148 RepID=A0A0D9YQA5_9ORYZ